MSAIPFEAQQNPETIAPPNADIVMAGQILGNFEQTLAITPSVEGFVDQPQIQNLNQLAVEADKNVIPDGHDCTRCAIVANCSLLNLAAENGGNNPLMMRMNAIKALNTDNPGFMQQLGKEEREALIKNRIADFSSTETSTPTTSDISLGETSSPVESTAPVRIKIEEPTPIEKPIIEFIPSTPPSSVEALPVYQPEEVKTPEKISQPSSPSVETIKTEAPSHTPTAVENVTAGYDMHAMHKPELSSIPIPKEVQTSSVPHQETYQYIAEKSSVEEKNWEVTLTKTQSVSTEKVNTAIISETPPEAVPVPSPSPGEVQKSVSDREIPAIPIVVQEVREVPIRMVQPETPLNLKSKTVDSQKKTTVHSYEDKVEIPKVEKTEKPKDSLQSERIQPIPIEPVETAKEELEDKATEEMEFVLTFPAVEEPQERYTESFEENIEKNDVAITKTFIQENPAEIFFSSEMETQEVVETDKRDEIIESPAEDNPVQELDAFSQEFTTVFEFTPQEEMTEVSMEIPIMSIDAEETVLEVTETNILENETIMTDSFSEEVVNDQVPLIESEIKEEKTTEVQVQKEPVIFVESTPEDLSKKVKKQVKKEIITQKEKIVAVVVISKARKENFAIPTSYEKQKKPPEKKNKDTYTYELCPLKKEELDNLVLSLSEIVHLLKTVQVNRTGEKNLENILKHILKEVAPEEFKNDPSGNTDDNATIVLWYITQVMRCIADVEFLFL